MSRTALVLMAIICLGACESGARVPPTRPLAPPSSDLPAKYAHFHGVWSGKWDGTWDVTFVIDDVSNNGHANGHYYWKETVPGAWNYDTVSGEIDDRGSGFKS